MNIVKTIISSLRVAVILAGSALCFSCVEKDENFGIDGKDEGIDYTYHGNRIDHVESRRVLLFYECGFNSLYGYLSTNMSTLKRGTSPATGGMTMSSSCFPR